ncbi:MAG: BolA family protein [Gammaproteobacteria bacterium]
MNAERVEKIRQRLTDALAPVALDIEDDSARHAGHAGAAGGAGHFNARIVSEAFAGKRLLERHRMVYAALGDMMNTEIHAFSMECRSPDEV